jgi:O-succinylbenzoate synthase
MKIEKVELIHIRLVFKHSYLTGAGGGGKDRHLLIVKMYADGIIGYGEASANYDPHYSPETTGTALHILRDFLVPPLLHMDINNVEDLIATMSWCKDHNMAKSGLETVFWDLLAREKGVPLSKLLGGTARRIKTGVGIGIQNSVEELLEKIEMFLDQGYQKIKVKIRPGWDYEILGRVRDKFGDINLMVDANSSYRLKNLSIFKKLDELSLMMIEQPLAHDDLIEHSKLQREIKTPICLDESMCSLRDAMAAIELRSCKIINIKISRVGGLWQAKLIHDFCRTKRIPVWCGSMLESGVGEAYNIAIATLPNYSLPADIATSDRYFYEDIVRPSIVLNPDGTIDVPTRPGMGYDVDFDKLNRHTVEKITIT